MEVPEIVGGTDARWHAHAACARAGPDGFYTGRSAAVRLCGSCPAAEPCLWAALAWEDTAGYRHGVWGGTTPARRARIAAGLPRADLVACYLAVVDAWAAARNERPPSTRAVSVPVSPPGQQPEPGRRAA